jgi:hypothetical protein
MPFDPNMFAVTSADQDDLLSKPRMSLQHDGQTKGGSAPVRSVFIAI